MTLLANFRDLGGILTRDGRRVRAGRVLRSAAPAYASASELDTMATLGVRYICDFRSDPERPADPSQWTRACGIDYWLPNVGKSVGDPVVALARCTIDVQTTEALVHDVYRRIAFDQGPSFRLLFARLLAGEYPHLIHCASGKDRTGVFVALLLHALDVPRPTILADFALSNNAVGHITRVFRDDPRHAPLIAAPEEVWAPLMRADPAVLETLHATLEKGYGSLDRFLDQELGVGSAERQRLREQLLENQER